MDEQLIDSNFGDPLRDVTEPLTYHAVHQQLRQLPDNHPSHLLAPHLERLLASEATPDEVTVEDHSEQPVPDIANANVATETSAPLRMDPLWPEDVMENLQESFSLAEEPELPEDEAPPDIPEKSPLPSLEQLTAEVRESNKKREEDNSGRYDMPVALTEVLKQGQYSAEQLAEFVNESRIASELNAARIYAQIGRQQSHYFDTLWSIAHVPTPKLQAAYHLPELSDSLRHVLGHADGTYEESTALKSFMRIYNLEDPLDLYEPSGQPAQDPAVRDLLTYGSRCARLISDTLTEPNAKWPENGDLNAATTVKRDWAKRYLEHVVGLPEKLSDELLYATYSQTTNQQTGYVDSVALQHRLRETYEATRGLTTEQLIQLREQAGIVNFGNYFNRQLEFMSKFLNGDPAAIEHLQQGDTTVVMSDGKGDHNGAIRGTNWEFESENHRTLFFEINRPINLYRHLLTVAKHGIKPSTIVIAAHGEPGSINFGTTVDGFSILNTGRKPGRYYPSPYRKFIVEAHGLTKAVENLMQDSRGIDDNPEAVGRRRIVFKSCSLAKPTTVFRYRQPGQRSDPDFTPVNDTDPLYDGLLVGDESMAAAFAKTANHPNLDVFAGQEDLAIIRTADGVKLETFVLTPDNKEVTIPFDATHYRLDTHGNLVEKHVAEIKLRNRNAKAVTNGNGN